MAPETSFRARLERSLIKTTYEGTTEQLAAAREQRSGSLADKRQPLACIALDSDNQKTDTCFLETFQEFSRCSPGPRVLFSSSVREAIAADVLFLFPTTADAELSYPIDLVYLGFRLRKVLRTYLVWPVVSEALEQSAAEQVGLSEVLAQAREYAEETVTSQLAAARAAHSVADSEGLSGFGSWLGDPSRMAMIHPELRVIIFHPKVALEGALLQDFGAAFPELGKSLEPAAKDAPWRRFPALTSESQQLSSGREVKGLQAHTPLAPSTPRALNPVAAPEEGHREGHPQGHTDESPDISLKEAQALVLALESNETQESCTWALDLMHNLPPWLEELAHRTEALGVDLQNASKILKTFEFAFKAEFGRPSFPPPRVRLGVISLTEAGKALLQRLYRLLAHDLHPDKNPDKEGTEAAFKELSYAKANNNLAQVVVLAAKHEVGSCGDWAGLRESDISKDIEGCNEGISTQIAHMRETLAWRWISAADQSDSLRAEMEARLDRKPWPPASDCSPEAPAAASFEQQSPAPAPANQHAASASCWKGQVPDTQQRQQKQTPSPGFHSTGDPVYTPPPQWLDRLIARGKAAEAQEHSIREELPSCFRRFAQHFHSSLIKGRKDKLKCYTEPFSFERATPFTISEPGLRKVAELATRLALLLGPNGQGQHASAEPLKNLNKAEKLYDLIELLHIAGLYKVPGNFVDEAEKQNLTADCQAITDQRMAWMECVEEWGEWKWAHDSPAEQAKKEDELRSAMEAYEYGSRDENDILHGQVYSEGTFSSGDKYVAEGTFFHGVIRGHVSITGQAGFSFKGNMEYNKRHGYGEEVCVDGFRYKGNYKNNAAHGQGTAWYTDGYVYKGSFEEGKWHGHGILTGSNGYKYKGDFRKHVFCGQGKVWYSDGDVYEGSFADDKRHGHGTYTFSNGAKYEGDYKNDERHGHGKLSFADGSVYEGSFADDERDGYGVWTHPSGAKHEGIYKSGKRHGQGIFHTKDGEVYRGSFENGDMHGYGVLTERDGTQSSGMWQNDKRVGGGTSKKSGGCIVS